MPDQPPSFSAFQKSGGGDDADSWHDLVAAVVAAGGSPRVCPPAALFAGIERKLGFVPQQPVWWRSSRVLGGAAAALVASLGWLAWRASAPRDGDTQVASAAPSASSAAGAEDFSTAAGFPNAAGIAANSVAKATPPAAAVGTGFAPTAPSVPVLTPPAQQPFIAAKSDVARSGVARGGSGTTSTGEAVIDEATFAAAQSFGRVKGTEPIELRSDFYVVGMIAAALQDPVSANPYESIVQPLEWTDWRSGYEFGAELPPSETLALSATWTWQDPRNQSLVAGAASSDGFEPSVVHPVPGASVSSIPGASASIVAPEPVAGSAARTQVQPPADEPKP